MKRSDQSSPCSTLITLFMLMVSLLMQTADRLSYRQIAFQMGDRGFQPISFTDLVRL